MSLIDTVDYKQAKRIGQESGFAVEDGAARLTPLATPGGLHNFCYGAHKSAINLLIKYADNIQSNFTLDLRWEIHGYKTLS
jgi:hypothetical protein